MLYKVFLIFESVDEILNCYHSIQDYWTVLSCGTVNFAVQGWPCVGLSPFKWRLLRRRLRASGTVGQVHYMSTRDNNLSLLTMATFRSGRLRSLREFKGV